MLGGGALIQGSFIETNGLIVTGMYGNGLSDRGSFTCTGAS